MNDVKRWRQSNVDNLEDIIGELKEKLKKLEQKLKEEIKELNYLRNMEEKLLKFLQESNAIEKVYDADSLFQAFVAWEYIIEQDKLTLGNILKTHKILMLHQPIYSNQKGYFRDCNVSVGNRICPPHAKVRGLMDAWVKTYDRNVIDPKTAHIAFEEIHPFIDGNGRIGRIIMNWHGIKKGLPILIIHEGEQQQEYYRWFELL